MARSYFMLMFQASLHFTFILEMITHNDAVERLTHNGAVERLTHNGAVERLTNIDAV